RLSSSRAARRCTGGARRVSCKPKCLLCSPAWRWPMRCPRCQQGLTQFGKFWICPEHGPVQADAAATVAALPPGRPAAGSAGAESVPGHVLEGEVGRGGMGVVYRARQVRLNRTVALKMILHAEHASEGERRRFFSEARALARLEHENIVRVHD